MQITNVFKKLSDKTEELKSTLPSEYVQIVEQSIIKHRQFVEMMTKAAERIAEQPEQDEDFGNAMFHLWINADNRAEQLEARCVELEQELQHARHDNGVLLRMLATAHGEKLTGGTSH